MEVTGKIIAVLPAAGGISSNGNEWKKQEYILETMEQYPKKVCFQLFGSNRIDQAAIKQGEEVTVSFDIESREFNGKWYTNINGWKVERRTAAPVQDAAPSASQSQFATPPPDMGNGIVVNYPDDRGDIPGQPLPPVVDDLPF